MSGIQALYDEINKHLIQDDRPSEFLGSVCHLPLFETYPFEMLEKLKHTKQSPTHHPEGHAWNHTMLVINEAAKIKSKSTNPRVLMWSALLHDIGKPDTTKTRKGKVTSYDHDKVGATLARDFLETFSKDTDFINSVVALVRWHMQILFVVRNLPFADVKTMKNEAPVHEVALLGLCDRLGRLNVEKAKEKENIQLFLKKSHTKEVKYMAKQGMNREHPAKTEKKNKPHVPELQGKEKTGKQKVEEKKN